MSTSDNEMSELEQLEQLELEQLELEQLELAQPEQSDEECSICKTHIEIKDQNRLECSHIFHRGCTYDRKGRLRFKNCPLCRQVIENHCQLCKKPFRGVPVILPCHTVCYGCCSQIFCRICKKEIYDVKIIERIYDLESIAIVLNIDKRKGINGGNNIYNPFAFSSRHIEKRCSVIVVNNLIANVNFYMIKLCDYDFECYCVRKSLVRKNEGERYRMSGLLSMRIALVSHNGLFHVKFQKGKNSPNCSSIYQCSHIRLVGDSFERIKQKGVNLERTLIHVPTIVIKN